MMADHESLSGFASSDAIAIPDSHLRLVPFQASERAYAALAAIILEVHPEWARPASHLPYQDQSRPSYCAHERWFVVDGHRVVGAANCSHLVWAFNPQHFILNIGLAKGIPNRVWHAIHALIVDHISDFNPTKLVLIALANRPHEIEALSALGYAHKTTCPRSQLDVAQFQDEPFSSLREGFAQRGYRIDTARSLAASDANFEAKLYALNMEADADLPMQLEFTPPPMDVWRRYIFESPSFMADASFIARHHDTYIGLSDLRGPTVHPDRLDVGFTGVARAYRRQGIATALKLATIDFARQHELRFIWTDNDERNPMYAINVKLGFKALPAMYEFHKDL